MAKLAVLFLATLAFQAAFAGVRRYPGSTYGSYGSYKKGGQQLENLVGQIQSVTGELSSAFQNGLPNSRQVYKTLTWQSRELAQYIDEIVNRLQSEITTGSGAYQQVLSELRQIEGSLRQAAGYTDISNVNQLKVQFSSDIESAVEQFEKLVRIVEVDSQGSLYAIVKGALVDFLNGIQSIQTQVQYIGQRNFIGQDSNRVTIQIQEVTSGLLNALQGSYSGKQQLRLALREYAQNIENIIERLQGEFIGAGEYNNIAQELGSKLRQVLVCLNQINEFQVNATELKSELEIQLQRVAGVLEQLVQAGSYQGAALVEEIIGEYLSATQQAKIQIQGGFIRGYGLQGFQNDFQGEYLGEYQGKYNLGKYQGLYGKTGYYGKTQYGQSGKGLAIQIQAVVSELTESLQNVVVDNTFVRQVLVNQIRQYVRYLDLIVERLQSAGTTTYVSEVNGQQVVENLKQIVESLRQAVSTGATIPASELRTQLSLYVQKAANQFEKLATVYQTGAQQTNGVVRNVIVQFLIATRNLQVQVQNITYFGQAGQTTRGLGIQIQSLANGLTTSLQSVAIDNKQTREVLAEQCREFARDLKNIINRLESSVTYTGVPQNIAGNLQQIVASLQQIASYQDYTTAPKLRLQLTINIQNAVNEIQKLLWAGNYSQTQGYDNAKYYSILNDFAIALQNQQIQLQNIYQSSQYGQNTQQLAYQIQAVTNNLAIFLQNNNYNGEQGRQNIAHQVRRVAQTIENIIERLEVEASGEAGVFGKVAQNLKQIVGSLEQEIGASNYELGSQLYIVLQNVAGELRKLAWIGQYGAQQGQGNYVVRSVLIQYLVTIQNVQIQVQGIYQTYQIGQSPRELALQIQVVANRLSGMLYVAVPESRQTANSLVWQARRLGQIIENIVYRLQGQYQTGSGKIDNVLQQVAQNLQQIQQSLKQVIVQTSAISVQQLKVQLAVVIQDAAVEIQKLIYVAEPDVQQAQGNALVRNVLIDILYGLQNLQIQIQSNLQVVLGGQNPRSLAVQIQSAANRISSFLQYAQHSNSQYLRQNLIIQIGELAQTVENVINVLQTEVNNNGADSINALQEIAAQLTKISQQLQQITGNQSAKTVEQLSYQLNAQVQNVASELERLAYVAQYQFQQQKQGRVGTVLNGAFNNLLATLRNMLIQFQNTYQIGQYGQNVKELSNQIQTVSNTLTNSLQNVFANTKQVRQALAIQTLKYARRIQYIAHRLQAENTYYGGVNGNTLQQVAQNLRQVVASLQQIGQSVVSVTANELRTYLNTQVQNAAAQIQKLLVLQSLQQNQAGVDTVARSVLIEYLSAVQNLQIQVQNIAQRGQKGQTLRQLATQIEITVFDLSRYLERVVPTNQLAAKTFQVEARQLAKVIANIAGKLQTGNAYGTGKGQILFQQVAQQLRQIQLTLQQVTGVQGINQIKVQLAVQVQNTAAIIEQLVWTVQPQLQQIQGNTGTVAVVRACLEEFLTAVQNIQIQIQTIVQNGQTVQYAFGLGGLEGQLAGELSYQGGYNKALLGDYIGGYGIGNSQIYQYPRQLVIDIQNIVNEVSATLQSPVNYDQQTVQTLTYQVREFAQIIANIVSELQRQNGYGYGNAVVLQQVAVRLNQIQQTLQQIAGYTTLNNVNQLRTEFDVEIQNAAAEIEKLVWIVQQSQGGLEVVVRQVLNQFLNGVQGIQRQIQGIAQVGAYEYGLGGQYGQGYGLNGQYRQGYGLAGQYRQRYGLGGQYGQGYGYGNQYEQDNEYGQDYRYGGLNRLGGLYNRYSLYGRGYGLGRGLQGGLDEEIQGGEYDQGLYGSRYGQGLYGYPEQYGYQGLYDDEFYGNGLQGLYGYQGQYGNQRYGYGIQSFQNQGVSELARQVEAVASQVAEEFQTAISGNAQVKQIIFVQGRQLAQIIDNIIDRLQSEIRTTGTVQQVIDNLRQIRVQLQQVARSGFFYGLGQIRGQIASQIQNVAEELQKLAYVAQGEYQLVQGTEQEAIRSALVQYLVYLRNVQYQLQGNGLYLQNPSDLVDQLQLAATGVSGYLRNNYPYGAQRGLSSYAREYAQNAASIIDRLQSQAAIGKEGDYISLNQALRRLNPILEGIQQDSDDDVAEFHIRLGNNVQDVAGELQNWYKIAQPQYQDSENGLDFLAAGVLGDFLDATQNLHYRIQDFDRTY